ncbi:MAG: hypothetical protein AAFV80_13780, partial [Bacteroidota bacterium]
MPIRCASFEFVGQKYRISLCLDAVANQIIDHRSSIMLHFASISDYCRGIHISAPKFAEYDVRRFEDNMATVHQRMPQFKHEFYAIALKLEGRGYVKTGNFATETPQATVFFNSPYQILYWDIAPDWEGYYIIFSEDF